jgi:hypothetical protein
VFYLGLKILVNNLKSIGNIAKFTLLGIWLCAIIGLFIIGIKQASEHAFDASVTKNEQLLITKNDTLKVSMKGNASYSKHFGRHSNFFKTVYDDKDKKIIYRTDVRLIVRSTKDSLASISIEKNAHASDYQKAKVRAQNINYNYAFSNKHLELDAYLTTEFKNKFGEQEIEVILYLPEGTVFYADKNTYSFHSNYSYHNDILDNGMEEHYLQVINDDVICLDCDDHMTFKSDTRSRLKIDENGIEIKSDDSSLKIDKNGIKGKSEDVKVDINKNGIHISSDDN